VSDFGLPWRLEMTDRHETGDQDVYDIRNAADDTVMCNQTYYNIAPSQEVAEWLMGLANGTEAHSRSEYKRLTTLKVETTLKGEPNLLAENARLKAEVETLKDERAKAALQHLADTAQCDGTYFDGPSHVQQIAMLRAACQAIVAAKNATQALSAVALAETALRGEG
jgi:hypothetical protein